MDGARDQRLLVADGRLDALKTTSAPWSRGPWSVVRGPWSKKHEPHSELQRNSERRGARN